MSYHQSNPYLEPAKEEPDAPAAPAQGAAGQRSPDRLLPVLGRLLPLHGRPGRLPRPRAQQEPHRRGRTQHRTVERLPQGLAESPSEAKAAEEERRYNQRIAERSKEPPDAIE